MGWARVCGERGSSTFAVSIPVPAGTYENPKQSWLSATFLQLKPPKVIWR